MMTNWSASPSTAAESLGLCRELVRIGRGFSGSGQLPEVACLIADIRMPGMSGLDLQAKLRAESYAIPIVFITAHGDEKMCLQAMRAGAVGFRAGINAGPLLRSIGSRTIQRKWRREGGIRMSEVHGGGTRAPAFSTHYRGSDTSALALGASLVRQDQIKIASLVSHLRLGAQTSLRDRLSSLVR